MSREASILVQIKADRSEDLDVGTRKNTIDHKFRKLLTSGTGADQYDLEFSDERTISASGSEDLDLAGVLADAFGGTITMVEVVAILITADAGNTNDVVVGDATSPIPLFGGTNPTFAIKPGGFFAVGAFKAPGLLTVGAGSTDDLKIANSSSGSSVTYKITILGRSA